MFWIKIYAVDVVVLSGMSEPVQHHHQPRRRSAHQSVPRVGYWFSEKKSRKFDLERFRECCALAGLDLVKVCVKCQA